MTKNGISIQPPRGKYLAIGMMSGTSCDGLDLALLEFDGRDFVFRKGHHTSYLPAQREAILNFITSEKNSLADVSQFNFYLAGIWARSVAEFLQSEKLTSGDILFLASHGQTAWHQPEESVFGGEKMISTLQLGDPSVLANLTGITTIGDFRVADMALGGQGAPLVPYFDWLYFSRFQKNIIALNIGGISNLTWLAAGAAPESVQAFDCGPGNMLVDQAMQRLYELPFDEDGRVSTAGATQINRTRILRQGVYPGSIAKSIAFPRS
jgi:anhydro-N-acetylmuramic acid kinase